MVIKLRKLQELVLRNESLRNFYLILEIINNSICSHCVMENYNDPLFLTDVTIYCERQPEMKIRFKVKSQNLSIFPVKTASLKDHVQRKYGLTLFYDGGPYHIETGPLIYSDWFLYLATSIMKELMVSFVL